MAKTCTITNTQNFDPSEVWPSTSQAIPFSVILIRFAQDVTWATPLDGCQC